MRKNFILIIVMLLLFAQCKKENVMIAGNDDEVPVIIDIPLNESKTYFGDVIDSGKISWWNIHNEEYIYLAIGYNLVNEDNNVVRKGVLEEMKIAIYEVKDVVTCRGTIPKNYIRSGRRYELYYFGNNGNGRENTNVTNIYDEETGDVIGKTVVFNNQNGDMRNLGDYHMASVTVLVVDEKDDNGEFSGYRLIPEGKLNNKMSIALLDLSGERSLRGSATYNSVYEVKWNGNVFEEKIYSNDMEFNVENNMGDRSYISLLPNDNVVSLECTKGYYVFENGIESNSIYIGGGNASDDVKPLGWFKP